MPESPKDKKGKRLIVLCDGTWNRSDALHPTNVVRTAQIMRPEGDDGVPQVPFYVPGVGTGQGSSRIARATDRWLGGTMGWGLYANVIDAYRHLVFAYEPGDQIFLFGFSRGAFTARSLAGLIGAVGILSRDKLPELKRAVDRYRARRPNHQEGEADWTFRREVSRVATTQDEVVWRFEQGDEPDLLRIRYLGVWDTVGALGIPRHLALLSRAFNSNYSFHNTDLSPLVEAARHAVAIDERRQSFEPTLWDNLDDLNALIPDQTPYRQLWFPGDHGSVGGGGDLTHLSSIALNWMLDGAAEAGLALDQTAKDALADEADIEGSLSNRSTPPGLVAKALSITARDRKPPSSEADLHDATLDRWEAALDPPYRPGPLRNLETRIAQALEARRTRHA